jgi:hypothetical protein
MGSISFDLIVETPSFVRGQHSVALPQEIYVFKSEARNPKLSFGLPIVPMGARFRNKAQNPKCKCSKRNVRDITQIAGNPNNTGTRYGDRDFCFCHWGIRYLNIVSDFDIRISDFHKAPTANHALLA